MWLFVIVSLLFMKKRAHCSLLFLISVILDFEYDSHLKYPTFTFGGVKGQTISSVVFRKK